MQREKVKHKTWIIICSGRVELLTIGSMKQFTQKIFEEKLKKIPGVENRSFIEKKKSLLNNILQTEKNRKKYQYFNIWASMVVKVLCLFVV